MGKIETEVFYGDKGIDEIFNRLIELKIIEVKNKIEHHGIDENVQDKDTNNLSKHNSEVIG